MTDSPTVLRGGYKGSSVFDSLDSPFPASFAKETDGYDYDSDSDIEDEDEDDADTSAPNKAPEAAKEVGPHPFGFGFVQDFDVEMLADRTASM